MQVESSDRITVVFCTYQSLDRLSEAQKIGTPEFDLIICDEAHRTTGIDKEKHLGSNQKNSNFVSIYNQDFISGRKRLYMTATPRIYTEQAHRVAPIRVVVGNPPWSMGQKSANDNNANRKYKNLDKSIRGSYAARSKATAHNSLYDSYIRAIRWASNRIGNEGIVALVTNAGWLESISADGMRLCLEEEFDAIWLFNLRGGPRISRKKGKKEKGNVFGQTSRTPVVISLFIKNPHNHRPKAEIHYHDIGDYLSIDDKLDQIRNASITSLDWKCIKPSIEGDWLNSHDPLFSTFVELGNGKVKRGKVAQPETIFRSYSRGVATSRDAWVYNFSKEKVAQNMERMIGNYNQQCGLARKYS